MIKSQFSGGESEKDAALAPLPENPLLRSGLALAGANQRRSGEDDGLLTALETASIDLWGTRIVMLSACETGVGQIENGEGVQGLRRALVLSGAETQIMSLWKIDDRATAELVRGYYTHVLTGISRSEAMRQVQLEMLEHPATANPYYWAPFIVSGDGRSLDRTDSPSVQAQRPSLTASALLSRKPPARGCSCSTPGLAAKQHHGGWFGLILLGGAALQIRLRTEKRQLLKRRASAMPDR